MDEILTVFETAKLLKKHPDTIRRWIEVKKLPARKLSAGGNGIWVILRSDLLELVLSESAKAKEKVKKHPKKTPSPLEFQTQLPI